MATIPKKRKPESDATPAADPKPARPPTLYFPITDDPDETPASAAAEVAAGGGSDEEDSDEEEESIESILESFSREQLVTLLRAAAASDASAAAALHAAADADPASRKLFVHGLGWGATPDDLRASFARYGAIEDVRVVSDRATGRSKGYGFVLFHTRRSARRALRRPQKTVAGRITNCHLAAVPPPQNANSVNSGAAATSNSTNHADNLARKIFVGNVHADVDINRLMEFFSQFGEIEEGPLGFDKVTGKPKGFAMFVYKTLEGAQRALQEPVRIFDGKMLNVQKAVDGKLKNLPASNNNNHSIANAAAAATNAGAAGSTPPPPVNVAGYDMSAYGGGVVAPDMGLAAAAAAVAAQQQAAMIGQGMVGMAGQQVSPAFAQGLQPNAAMLAMMAAAMQNPVMLASFNPAFAAAMQGYGTQGFGAQAAYSAGNSGFQNTLVGVQGQTGTQVPPGFQGPPGYQGAGYQVAQQGNSNSVGQGQMSGAQMGAYGQH